MNRAQVLEALASVKPELAARYGVIRLALFGSTARDCARVDSDIDILVSFDGPATSARYFGVQFLLEDLLGRPVGLVTGTGRSRADPQQKSGIPNMLPRTSHSAVDIPNGSPGGMLGSVRAAARVRRQASRCDRTQR